MGGFKKVLPGKEQQLQQPLNNANAYNICLASNEEKEDVLKKCYEKFIDLPVEEQQRIMQIIQPQSHVPVKEKDQIYDIINYLIEKDKAVPNVNPRQRINLIANQPRYEMIMRVFEAKFDQMTKSKEEMIKFCMRKAFKFVYDKIVSEKKQKLNKKEQKQLKNEYFGITNESEYALPFRDDSAEKTMNEDFLKNTFALKNFINDYKLFLESYDDILEKDNQKKINILVEQILETTDINFEQGLNKIKRIPWSRDILQQTKRLAAELLQKHGTINEQCYSQKVGQQNMNGQSNDVFGNTVISDNLGGNEQCQQNQYNMQGMSILNKAKQIFISYDEFKSLLFNISRSSNFKDLVTLVQKDFIKTEYNPRQSEFQSTQTDMNQNSKDEYSINIKQEGQEFHNLLSDQPYKKLHIEDTKQENHLMESPDISQNNKEKYTIETKIGGDNCMQVKEELNESTKCRPVKDCTPDPQTIKNIQRTTQFSISPHQQNNQFQMNNMNNSHLQPQQQIFTEQMHQKNISPNPFSLVNIQNIQGIFNSQASPNLPQLNQQIPQNQLNQQMPLNQLNQQIPLLQQIPKNQLNGQVSQNISPFNNGLIQNQNLYQNSQYKHQDSSNSFLNEQNNNPFMNLFSLEQLLSQQQGNQGNQHYLPTNSSSNFSTQLEQDLQPHSFLQFLIQYQELLKQTPSVPQNNLSNPSILNFQNIFSAQAPPIQNQIKDLSHQQTDPIKQMNIGQRNDDMNKQNIESAISSSQPNKNINQNINSLSDQFSNAYNEINLNLIKNNLSQSVLSSFIQNPQFYLPLSESQLNIKKQQDSLAGNVNEELFFNKESQRYDQQETKPRK